MYWNIEAKSCFNLNQLCQSYKIIGEYHYAAIIPFGFHGIHGTAALYFCAEPAQKQTFPTGSAPLKLICREGTWIAGEASGIFPVSLQWWIWTSWRRRRGCTVAPRATSRCRWGRSWKGRTPSSGRCVCWWNAVVETVPVVSRAATSANVCQQKSPKSTTRYALFLNFRVWKHWKPVRVFIFNKMNAPTLII